MAGNGESMSAQLAGTSATSPGANDANSSSATSNPKLRKRTKTGCLTCRKRRIKCGEERPTCNNCIKSKRHCEGYNQRVIFKPPLGDWSGLQHGTAGTLPYHNGMIPAAAAAPYQRAVPPPINTQDAGFTPLQPRPSHRSAYDEHGQPYQFGPPSAGLPFMGGGQGQGQGMPMTSPHTPFAPYWTPVTPQYSHPMFPPQESPMSASTNHSFHSQLHTPLGPPSSFVPSPNIDQNWHQAQQSSSFPEPPTPSSSGLQDYKPFFAAESVPTPAQSQDGGEPSQFPFQTPDRSSAIWDPNVEFIIINTPPQSQYPVQGIDSASWPEPLNANTDMKPPPSRLDAPSAHAGFATAQEDRKPIVSSIDFVGTASDLLEQAAVENEDDDYFDVQSDEEMEIPPDQTMVRLHENQRDFGMIMALHRENSSELTMRRYDTFIYAGILDHYRAEWVANPLRNPKTARVFAHFIFATGPTISIYERNSRNASAMFSETPVPNSQQGLWTYVLPMMALNHQGLLHAMLALASLHIAKLQGASVTPSYKHYAYALKRIHHCVGKGKKRHLPTTIAATLLLGFYEVMTADHLKWSSHLQGAKQLMVEIDFQGMTQEYRRIKAEKATQEHKFSYDDETALQERTPSGTFRDLGPAIDESLVSTLIGRKLKYDEFGRIIDDLPKPRLPGDAIPPPLDTAKYELYQDLYWWYARQDVYQAIVSGNRLLLDYSRWAHCPPRASMGRADAVYGTHDHLFLLLARIADFVARDRKRKVKVMDANGGHWRPPADLDLGSPTLGRNPMLSGAPPGQAGPQGQNIPQRFGSPGGGQMPPPNQQAQRGPRPQGPTFFGMAPMPTNASMPSSYAADGAHSTPSPKSERSDCDLEAATQAALQEWSQIRSALNTFKSHFGPQFQALPPELHQPTPTPFGPALQYRSYDVAVLWALYYMSYIIAMRSHPHLPPAAMMASVIAAQQTAPFARLIGQIAGGIVPPHPGQPLNPSLGASLCEVSMPLFFAGIQYTDHAQRTWLVNHVRAIEARTGWASVGMIAQGCETAWVKAFESGRGPPYEMTKEAWHIQRAHDPRVAHTGGHFDGEEPDPGDMSDRRWASTNPGTRVHWAMGLLSVEEDVHGISRHVSGSAQPLAT